MDEGESREALRAIEELSDEARHYGSEKWVDAASTPRQVINLVRKAAARHMKNPEGFVSSRAGDETVTWSDLRERMGDAQFTADERKRLRELGGNYHSGLHSVGVFGYQRKTRSRVVTEGLVPCDDGSRPVPYFAHPTEPW